MVGYDLTITLFIGECSNPCNIMRKNWLYENKDKLAKKASILFAVSFLFMRCVAASWVCKRIFYSDIPFGIKFTVALMYFVGLYWSLLIFQLILKELSPVRFLVYFF